MGELDLFYIKHFMFTVWRVIRIGLCFLSITYIITLGILRPIAYICGPVEVVQTALGGGYGY